MFGVDVDATYLADCVDAGDVAGGDAVALGVCTTGAMVRLLGDPSIAHDGAMYVVCAAEVLIFCMARSASVMSDGKSRCLQAVGPGTVPRSGVECAGSCPKSWSMGLILDSSRTSGFEPSSARLPKPSSRSVKVSPPFVVGWIAGECVMGTMRLSQ